MRIAKWAVVIALGYAIGSVGTSFLESEVARVETRDGRGVALQTSVWILDEAGDVWIRASFPDAAWLARLRENPEVTLIRDGRRSQHHARIVRGVTRRIDAGMRAKYGRADEAFELLRDPRRAVVIRLDEFSGRHAWGGAHP